jgi:hypothetical protein
LGLAVGVGSLLLFNTLYFGAALNQTIIAKTVCYQPSHSPGAIAANLRQVFAGRLLDTGIYSPIASRYLVPFRELILALALAAFALACARFRRKSPLMALLVSSAVLVPIAYAVGGITVFPWYFYPSQIFAYLVFIALILDPAPGLPNWFSRLSRPLLLLLVLGCASALWLHSVGSGSSERFLADIGRDLKSLAKPTDTLFLEPAGTPPYYAELYTYDEVGLVSPLVTDYQRRFGPAWYYKFLSDFHPNWIVENKDTVATCCGAITATSDQAWFDGHYQKVKTYHYDAESYYDSPLMKKISAIHVAVGDYDLYRLKS